MATVKQALAMMLQELEDTKITDDRDKKYLELGLTSNDRDKINYDQVKNVGELIKILAKIDKNTPIDYNWASMSLELNKAQDGLYLYISD